MPVSKIFPSAINHSLDKIREYISKPGYEEPAIAGIEEIEKILEKFKSKMIAKGKFDPYQVPGYELGRLSYCFTKLKNFLGRKASNNLEVQDAEIFIDWAFNQVKELQEIAQQEDI